MLPPLSVKPDIIALFSQGLDSILAVRIIQRQGLKVHALKFISPFFGYEIKHHELQFRERMKLEYGIELSIIDLTDDYLEMLGQPQFGYGKNFNPCLDCKLMMLEKAREIAQEWRAAAIITGEVVGQRPFSQRRDTMHRLEKLSRTEGLLLRPLSAKLLPPSQAEGLGIVDREQLFAYSGRSRKLQIALAQKLGISNYPNPAGGCLLTDPGFAARLKTIYHRDITASDINLLKYGRFYPLATAGDFIIVGRHQRDNQRLLETAAADHFILHAAEIPGPVAVLRGGPENLEAAAEKICRHSRAQTLPRVTINWRRGKHCDSLTIAWRQKTHTTIEENPDER
ncbi:MAG: thiamine biosynthesis protein [Deltaproteobacteria bacterium]|nr:thiamine biosynthesis protein [Deltaproteobacteria bacterium]